MAIVFPLDFPRSVPREMHMRAHSTAGVSSSPFTGAEQVYVHPREMWEMELVMPPLRRDQAEEVIGFLLALNGREGTFLVGDPIGRNPRGVGTGVPLVNGAGQTGKTLATKGWTPNTTGILKVGDYIQLGSGSTTRLHKVLKELNVGAGGLATFDIWPRLRYSPADDAPIVVRNTRGIWRLTSNVSEWTVQLAQRYGITVSCMESMAL